MCSCCSMAGSGRASSPPMRPRASSVRQHRDRPANSRVGEHFRCSSTFGCSCTPTNKNRQKIYKIFNQKIYMYK
ncbi:hypothetical protein SETIT_3G298100v2 [Setaria italica]